MHRSRDSEAGLATVWSATAIAVLVVVLAVGLHLASAVHARHRAESAADLAALAGAQRAAYGATTACARATAVAGATGAIVRRCQLRGWVLLVEVRVDVPFAPAGTQAAGRAAAGP